MSVVKKIANEYAKLSEKVCTPKQVEYAIWENGEKGKIWQKNE